MRSLMRGPVQIAAAPATKHCCTPTLGSHRSRRACTPAPCVCALAAKETQPEEEGLLKHGQKFTKPMLD